MNTTTTERKRPPVLKIVATLTLLLAICGFFTFAIVQQRAQDAEHEKFCTETMAGARADAMLRFGC